jgi:hypothetical protein
LECHDILTLILGFQLLIFIPLEIPATIDVAGPATFQPVSNRGRFWQVLGHPFLAKLRKSQQKSTIDVEVLPRSSLCRIVAGFGRFWATPFLAKLRKSQRKSTIGVAGPATF